MDLENVNGQIFYYCREKYFGKFQEVVKDCLIKYPDDPVYLMYSGFALVFNGRYLEGIRELNVLQSQEDIGLAVVMCLIHANKRSPTVDREAVEHLETRLKERRRSASSLSLYYAALFLTFIERYDKASDFISKAIKIDSSNQQINVLKGWIEIYKNENNPSYKIAEFFKASHLVDNFDAQIGLAKLKYFQKDFSEAILLLDNLITHHLKSEIIFIEKMKNELALFNWDQVTDIINQILAIDGENLAALKYKVLVTMCKNGDYIESADLLNKYFICLEKKEPKNSHLFHDATQLFSRACGRSNAVLTQVYRFAKHAAELNPSNTKYLTELGYQCFMQGKISDAYHFFKSATKVDDNSIEALCGLTLCQMSESGFSEQIEQQIELLNELMGSGSKDPLLLLMTAKLERKNADKALDYLNDASDVLFSVIRSMPYGSEHIKILNPDLLLSINKEYHNFIPKKPSVVIDSLVFNFEEILPAAVSRSLYLLEFVIKACPGLVPALYHLANLQFSYGKVMQAQANVQHLLDNIDPTYASAHLLLSQIYIQQHSFDRAQQSLEACLSYNFKIRDNALYHLLHGVIFKHQRKYTDALSCFISAINLLGTKYVKSIRTKGNSDTDLSLPDKATLFLELVNVYTELGQHADATKIMQDAIEEFSYTSEESRLAIVNAELALRKSDVDHAIELLSEIKPGQSYYLQAHTKLANIYLKEKNDRAMFATCFREIVANHPGSDGHTMLGDAYMSILEPSLAVEAYEKAIQQSPQDLTLAKKMGVALVKMHHYDKAIRHYKEAVKTLNNPELKLDLAELYIKLKHFEDAEEALSEELNDPATLNPADFISMKFRSKILMLLGKVRERREVTDVNSRAALATIKEAKENQTRLVKRALLESHDDIDEEKKILSEICFSLATHYASSKSTDLAIQTYKEALQYNSQNPAILLALAKLYMQVNESDLCQQTCSILLNADPDNEAASVMMADLAFKKVDFDTAAYHLKQLLSSQPTYWTALERLIDVQRRLGSLEDVTPFINKAQESGHSQEAGYLYCLGLKARHSGDPNAALRQWGKARTHGSTWGRAAALGVIGVCLAPGGEAMPPPLSDESSTESPEDAEYRDTRSFALGMAERLLGELKKEGGKDPGEALELKLLEARLALAGRKKSAAETALRNLLQLASEEGGADDVGVAVTLSTAYLVLKQPQRARNALKRVSRAAWTPEGAEWLERCWLLLADCLIIAGGSNSDAAREILDKALKHNKSCAPAYEYLGLLFEKEQSYKLAAKHYENAWEYGGHGNASVGYKYAYNLLKAKKYPEAIAASREVLISHPDCPKIRKEVFEKAANHLRC